MAHCVIKPRASLPFGNPTPMARSTSQENIQPRSLPTTCLLDGNRLGQVAREVDVKAFHNSEPVGDQLQRNDVENTLKDVDGLRDLNLLGLAGLELLIGRVADDDGLTATSDDY